jgi:hypothetical protein
MYKGYRVVAVTPAGRRRYLEVLAPYLVKNDLIDEWRLWVNTNIADDIACMNELASASDGKVTIEQGTGASTSNVHICKFFKNCCDPDTIYIRFDDDIVHIDRDAIRNLLDFRIKNPDFFLVYATIVNNAIVSHLYQRSGWLPSHKLVGYACMDHTGWQDPQFCEMVHRTFFEKGAAHLYDWVLNLYERVSINCFSFFGKDFAQFGGDVGLDEECWLSCDKSRELKRFNAICGNAVVCHFAYFTQREHMDKTDLLGKYKQLSLDAKIA